MVKKGAKTVVARRTVVSKVQQNLSESAGRVLELQWPNGHKKTKDGRAGNRIGVGQQPRYRNREGTNLA